MCIQEVSNGPKLYSNFSDKQLDSTHQVERGTAMLGAMYLGALTYCAAGGQSKVLDTMVAASVLGTMLLSSKGTFDTPKEKLILDQVFLQAKREVREAEWHLLNPNATPSKVYGTSLGYGTHLTDQGYLANGDLSFLKSKYAELIKPSCGECSMECRDTKLDRILDDALAKTQKVIAHHFPPVVEINQKTVFQTPSVVAPRIPPVEPHQIPTEFNPLAPLVETPQNLDMPDAYAGG